jgi:perosamine synthetase
MAGATPVLVDSLPDHWNMDPAQAEAACNERTRAIIVVHLLGHACEMGPLLELARRRGLRIVEDCAEALGCTWDGRQVGALGDIGTFSFYGNKVITTGEGGLCATADPELDRRLRVLRAHGMSPQRQYWHEVVGFNYRMTNLNAALGVAQLERMEELLARRRVLSELYDSLLGDLPGVRVRFQAPGRTIDWLYTLFLDEGLAPRRDELLERLHARGADVRPMFHPLHLMPPFAGLPHSPSLAQATRWGASGMLLPLFPGLREDQVRTVASHLADLLVGAAA